MRVLFSSIRGTGHLRPMFPYIDALIALGHEVRVAAPESVAGLLSAAGYVHVPFGHPGDARLKPIWDQAVGVTDAEMIALFGREVFGGVNPQAALPALRKIRDTWRPDLIVRESLEYGSFAMAAEAGLPHVRICVNNQYMEEAILDPVFEGLRGVFDATGLPGDPAAIYGREAGFTMFPERMDGDVVLRHGRVPRRVSHGRYAIPESGGARPEWAGEGPRPLVFVTLGTVAGSSEASRALFRAALAGVGALPVRVVLSTGPVLDRAALGEIPANVHVVEWVAAEEIYGRADAVLCHGGSGTLLAAVAHGVPVVVAPLTADQPDNARRLAATGAGLAVFEHEAEALGVAVRRALEDPDLRVNAREMAREMEAAISVEDAVAEMISQSHGTAV